MCGIAGIFNLSKKKILKEEIKKSLSSIKHRGPDDQGYWINNDNNIALMNTRLSIQDLSSNGKQPMISDDGRFVLVFNGEIYNFNSLKKNYLSNEFFKSNSDTEVILKLFIKYNNKFLEFLEGMFALAIYDKKLKQLLIARDEFGVKPLYYHLSDKQLIFSSEIKTFFKLGVNKKVNLRAISSYLSSEYYENRSKTFFKDIFKLESGKYVEFKGKKLFKKNYFNFRNYSRKIFIPKNYNDRKYKLKQIISRCVKNGLVSDVPVSIASSGGLDSSILQSEALRYNKNASLISWDFKESKFSERKYVNKISRITKINPIFHEISSKDILKNLEEAILVNEEPFAGVPIISYYLTLKNINKNKVILDGSGLDEANGGYDKYYSNNKNYNKLSQDGSYGVQNVINNNFLKKFPNYNSEITLVNSLGNKMFNDLFFVKLPRALRFRDKISASLGFELRPIFLDKELIGYLQKLKKQDHYKNNYTKYILRDTFKDQIGKEIALNSKRNIQTPQTQWFKRDLKIWLESLIDKSFLWETNILDKEKFMEVYNLFKKNKINNSFFIWQFINLHFFLRKNYI